MTDLPVDLILPELLATMQAVPNVVLSAAPGAGKTTRVPLALLKIIPPDAGKIVMLEPRRIAAASAARYMAALLGEQVGQTVGYTIRFERKVSSATRIEVVTEGVLTRRIQDDPGLKGVACVIFDEFHERSIHADLGLALCLESQAALRPDLKLLVMSATLDCGPISRLLGDAPLIVSEGRAFPVQVRYPVVAAREPFFRQVAAVVKCALTEEKGDLLVFLPGSREIRSVQRELDQLSGVAICPLYGDLPFEQQQQAVLPGPQRRVVLATNIAETSLTIEGVRIVVDSGLTRRLQLDPSTGLERLVTVRASQASVNQRTGRAGRTEEGCCYRLFSEHTCNGMTPFSPPEIMTADLAPLLLELAAWGMRLKGEGGDGVEYTVPGIKWLDLPPMPHITAGLELLQMLGAVDSAGAVTPLGRRMVTLPLHPRLARLMVAAEDYGDVSEACRFVARLSNRASAGAAIERTEKQLLQIMKGKSGKQGGIKYTVPEMVVVGWPDRIARRRQGAEGRYLLASGRGAASNRHYSEFIVALQVDGGQGADGVIHEAVEVTADQIRRIAPHLIREERQVVWDDPAGRVVAFEQEAIGVVLLSSRQVKAADDEAVPLLLEQVRRAATGLPGWSDEGRQLQSRVGLAASLLPEEGWPDISDDWLGQNLNDWLAPHLAGIRSWQEIERIDMLDILKDVVGWRLMQLLETVAPSHLQVPSGRRIALDYTGDEGPVLAVKLQELFGLPISPTVCRGRRAVLVHMLSPAGRPVAVTRDLQGFWERGYPEVRKELRGRYPKHPWPDDPWNAVATHKTKKALERS